MTRSALLAASVLLPVVCIAGCASAPAISAGSAGPGERRDDGRELTLTLVVRNTTDESIPLRRVEYTLSLDGVTVFTGERSAEATLGPGDTRELTLPAVVPLTGEAAHADLARGSHAYRLTGTLTYLTPGALAEALYDLNLRVPTESFAVEGEIALP